MNNSDLVFLCWFFCSWLAVIVFVYLIQYIKQNNCNHNYTIQDVELSVYNDNIVVEIEVTYKCINCNHIKTISQEVYCDINAFRTKEEWEEYALINKKFPIDKY